MLFEAKPIANTCLITLNRIFKRHASSLNLVSSINNFDVKNEPIYDYLNGSAERTALEASLRKFESQCTDVPLIVAGKEIRTSEVRYQVEPFNHQKKIAKFYHATKDVIKDAIQQLIKARYEWEKVPLQDKVNIFLKAGDLVSNKYRADLNAATMLGQSKTVIQAEIDAAAELADFFRFNAYFLKELCKYQPISVNPGEIKNTFRYRGLDGFVASISPFNFTAIGGNLASAPALMGNVVLWKPSDTALLSNYLVYKLLIEAGIPSEVISFLPADGPIFGDIVTASEHLAGINFTGSVATFKHLWQQTARNLNNYSSYPRLIGECGGKNFHFVHQSADVDHVVNSTIRAAFEYSGQKCSACSRMYVPKSLWSKIKEKLLAAVKEMKVSTPLDYETFFSAVIDARAFKRIAHYINYAKSSPTLSVLTESDYDDSVGYFIPATIIETSDPFDKIMKEEIFGPVLCVYVYDDRKVNETLDILVNTNDFALTGAIFGEDQEFLETATQKLKVAAGNFYVNDKSTGSIVGQQPFGGSKLSGTNDKAGGPHYLLRWASPQIVKENFVPAKSWKYSYMNK